MKRRFPSSSSSSSDSNSNSTIFVGSDAAAVVPPPDQSLKPRAKRVRKNQISIKCEVDNNVHSPRSGRRSSIYRGVTRHRWTGRYEAHLWDRSCWNNIQNKKGRQVYLGAYDCEEAAARTYDLAALKYWGPETILNFPIEKYKNEVEEMQKVSREEYLASLRRHSNGFSRGVSKYRGVARHHHNGRWEARIGRVFGNKYLYLGTYSTQEEAAAAYDIAAIEYRGANAVTNFDISNYTEALKKKGISLTHHIPYSVNKNEEAQVEVEREGEEPEAEVRVLEVEEAEAEVEVKAEAEQAQTQPKQEEETIMLADQVVAEYTEDMMSWSFYLDTGLAQFPHIPIDLEACAGTDDQLPELFGNFDDFVYNDNNEIDTMSSFFTDEEVEQKLVDVSRNIEEDDGGGGGGDKEKSVSSPSSSTSTTTSVSCN